MSRRFNTCRLVVDVQLPLGPRKLGHLGSFGVVLNPLPEPPATSVAFLVLCTTMNLVEEVGVWIGWDGNGIVSNHHPCQMDGRMHG